MAAIKKHILVGIGAAGLLIIVYIGIITLAQDWRHALKQTAELWYWILALVSGFGIQVGLFSFIRQSMRERRAANTGSVAASGAVSTGAMIACCAHHLSDLLPLLGLSGLALFLVRYQLFFIIVGVVANIVGITIMLDTIQRYGLCPWVARWRWNLGRIKTGAMISAAIILMIAFFLVY